MDVFLISAPGLPVPNGQRLMDRIKNEDRNQESIGELYSKKRCSGSFSGPVAAVPARDQTS